MPKQRQNIKVTIRLFAIYRERLGTKQVVISMPSPATVTNSLTELTRLHPKLAPLVEPTMVAVNQEYASGEYELQDGDEMALIPPVSGG
jgi:molybdopterin converting factor subunit 1